MENLNLEELKEEELITLNGGITGGGDITGFDSWSYDTSPNTSDDILVALALAPAGYIGTALGIAWSLLRS